MKNHWAVFLVSILTDRFYVLSQNNTRVKLFPSHQSKPHFQQYLTECHTVNFTMLEKLCLQWNDFKDDVTSAFGSLREDNDFADVTLACEDGKQIEANKVILAASSPFFQLLLKRNKHSHPLIYMRGVQYEDLVAIVDFLYFGEANIYQHNLDSFLAIAEELQLKGLMGEPHEEEKPHKKTAKKENETDTFKFSEPAPPPSIIGNDYDASVGTLELKSQVLGNLQELEEKIKSMMEKTSTISTKGKSLIRSRCKVCGKEGPHANDLRKHIEAKHLEGVSIPCHTCGKTFRCRILLLVKSKSTSFLKDIIFFPKRSDRDFICFGIMIKIFSGPGKLFSCIPKLQ